MVTREEFDELSSMIEDIHKYIFSNNFTPKREVKLNSAELKSILNIPHNTFSCWIKKKLLPFRKENGRLIFIALEVYQALLDKRITREARYVDEFRRNYIDNVR